MKPILIFGYAPDGMPVFVLPLVERCRGLVCLTQTMGDKHAAYLGPLCTSSLLAALDGRTTEHLFELIHKLIPKCDALVLDAQPDTLNGAPNPWVHLKRKETANKLHLTRLVPDWAAYDSAHRNSRSRGKERNRENGLKRLGDLEFVLPETAAERQQMYDVLCVQKSAWYRSTGLPDLLSDDSDHAFLKRIASLEHSDSGLWPLLSGLRLNGEWIALNFGVVHNGYYSGLLLSVAEGETRKFSPGHLLITKTLKYCTENGIQIFNFGAGNSDLKGRWADQSARLYLCSQAYTAKGRAYEICLHGVSDLHRQIKSNPYLWRRFEQLRRLRGSLAAAG